MQVKLSEEPYKFVKPRPKMKDLKNNIKITEATLPVYGEWQVEEFVPPVAENVSSRSRGIIGEVIGFDC